MLKTSRFGKVISKSSFLFGSIFILTLPLIPSNSIAQLPYITIIKYNGDSCRLAPYITTHWDSSSNHVSIGLGKDADTRKFLFLKNGFPHDKTIAPDFNNYHEMVTVGTAININTSGDKYHFDMNYDMLFNSGNGVADDIDYYAYLYRKKVKAKFGPHAGYLDILNYSYDDPTGNCFLRDSMPNTQILNNVKIGSHGLATVIFPPFWKKGGHGAYKYPIYIHGNGYGIPNTNRMYLDRVTRDVELGAGSYFHMRRDSGAIIIYFNNGGMESHGINQGFINDFRAFLKTTVTAFGGDINRVIAQGASRAGGEAAIWGTLSDGPNVKSILSIVPAVKFGSNSDFSLSTLPLLSLATRVFGSPHAWRHDYAGLTRTEKAQTACRILLGTSNLDSADLLSLYGRLDNADSLFLRKKFLSFTAGSHDAFFPIAYFLQLDSMLTKRKIKHHSRIGYNLGHNTPAKDELFDSAWIHINDSAYTYDGPTREIIIPGNSHLPNDNIPDTALIITDKIIDTIEHYRPGYFPEGRKHDPSALGFSATIPWKIIKNIPFEIVLSGQTGKKWRIWTRKENGYAKTFEAWGKFGSDSTNHDNTLSSLVPNTFIHKQNGGEFSILKNIVFADVDTLEWFFQYDGREIPDRFTPFATADSGYLRALSITANNESTDSLGFKEYYRDLNRISSSNGIDQLHPLLLVENITASFNSIPNSTVSLSQQSVSLDLRQFVNRGNPKENDSLRFDLKANGLYFKNITMNRSTGIVTLKTQGIAPGTYTATAYLSDGKGGNSSKSFYVIFVP